MFSREEIVSWIQNTEGLEYINICDDYVYFSDSYDLGREMYIHSRKK